MKSITGGICAPIGFTASGVHAGIRKKIGRPDLALIVSEVPAIVAGVFTKNRIKAAPVLLSRKVCKAGVCQAIVINSGNANACTGRIGMAHAKRMSLSVAQSLHLQADQVVVASTGVIGVRLPLKKVIAGIESAAEQVAISGADNAAEAIMTTDTFSKSIALEYQYAGKTIRLGGMSKGSGMIHPNMATMLGFITTDADVEHEVLEQALKHSVSRTFNMISVDGDTSTNDMAVILANGMANNERITNLDSPEGKLFYEALNTVCIFLAKEIARDGEGATKLIEVQVTGAKSEVQAQKAARTVCASPLVKTAIFGQDANWGRIACAVGYSGALIHMRDMKIILNGMLLFKDGQPVAFDETEASSRLSEKNIFIIVDLGVGQFSATAWGCDLTHDYININASYRS